MFEKEVQLFMIFDRLADTLRTGPTLWQIDRKRLEDVKNHILDLILIARILERKLPVILDMDKIFDYILCHDLPEAITGDITKFEGITNDEIKRVTQIAIDYLIEQFNDIIDFKTIITNFENRNDIEAKVVVMIDKVHSATTFLKYELEQHINPDNPNIIPVLRNHPYVVEKLSEGYDIGDIFFSFHMREVNISDEECKQFAIDRDTADMIVDVIECFAKEFYRQKVNGTLFNIYEQLPKDAMIHNRAIN